MVLCLSQHLLVSFRSYPFVVVVVVVVVLVDMFNRALAVQLDCNIFLLH